MPEETLTEAKHFIMQSSSPWLFKERVTRLFFEKHIQMSDFAIGVSLLFSLESMMIFGSGQHAPIQSLILLVSFAER
jgi:hypothetical protein